MAPPRQIPGFYYDAEKGKYFKVEKTATAPPDAAWASHNVKERSKRERRERQARSEQAKRTKVVGAVRPVRRCRAYRETALGWMAWAEYDGSRGGCPLARAEARGRMFAERLVGMGSVGLDGNEVLWGADNVKDFEVVVDEESGFANAYTPWALHNGEAVLFQQAIPTDETGRISFDPNKHGGRVLPRKADPIIQTTSFWPGAFGYSPDRRALFMAGRSFEDPRQMRYIWAELSVPWTQAGPFATPWTQALSGHPELPTSKFHEVNIPNLGHKVGALTGTSSPKGSPYLCILGTTHGAVLAHPQGKGSVLLRPTRDVGNIWAVTCSDSEPDLIMAGGNKGFIVAADARDPSRGGGAWSFNHGAAVTHLRAQTGGNTHHVLAAGLNSKMSLYDRRWLSSKGANKPGGSETQGVVQPLVRFTGYLNQSTIPIGFDVDDQLGVVVAAHQHGDVGVYSVSTGRRLGLLDLGRPKKPPGPVDVRAAAGETIGCVKIRRVPGEKLPSVFVGLGGAIGKYSYEVVDEVV